MKKMLAVMLSGMMILSGGIAVFAEETPADAVEETAEVAEEAADAADEADVDVEISEEALGDLLGSLLGFLFAQAVSRNVFNSSITLMPWLVPVTILASVLVTGIACLIPIRSATQVDPALVLKGE